MPTYQYQKGNNVCYQTNYYTIFKLRDVSGNPAYLIRNIENGIIHDNVAESELSNCDCSMIINRFWPNFVYTGDNGAASKWMMNNLIKNMCHGSGIEYGHNADSTVYTFSMNNGVDVWTKNKSN